MKKIFALLLVSVIASAAMAIEITFDPNVDNGNGSTAVSPFYIEKDGIKMEVSNGCIAPYRDVMAYRIYKGQTAKFTSEIGDITKIEVTTQFKNDTTWSAAGFQADGYTANTGEYYGTWNGSASPVVLNAAYFQVRASKIVVTVGDAGLAAPSFNPAAGTYYQPIEVTIRCATNGAQIYYTTNGSDPTTSSTLYSSPITLSSNTTVKAISYYNGETSAVVTANYEFTEAPSFTWCDMFDAPDNTTVIFTNPSVVLCQSGSTMYVKEKNSECYGLVYGTVNQTYQMGDVIPAGFGGKKTTYNEFPELINPTGFTPATENVTLEPVSVTPGEVTLDLWGHYLLFKSVIIDRDNMVLIGIDGSTIPYYPQITENIDLSERCDVFAIVTSLQVRIISIGYSDPPIKVCCLEDIYQRPMNEPVTLDCPLTTIYQNGVNLYVMDKCGEYGLIYGNMANDEFHNGDSIIGIAKWTTYQGMPQLTPIGDWQIVCHGPMVEPIDMNIEDLTSDDRHKYIRISDVTITADAHNERQFYITDATGEMVMYNKYNVDLPTLQPLKWPWERSGEVTIADIYFLIDHLMAGHTTTEREGTYDVTGFLTIYHEAVQLYPIDIAHHSPAYDYSSLDVNKDGEVNIGDVNTLIRYILGIN